MVIDDLKVIVVPDTYRGTKDSSRGSGGSGGDLRGNREGARPGGARSHQVGHMYI